MMDFMVDFGIDIHILLPKNESHVRNLLRQGSLGDSPVSWKSKSDDFPFGINFRLWEVVKLKQRKYAYLSIFSLTTFRNRKLIPKADLK